ncbi:TPA: hypothetical protein QHZ98_001697 [Klebsiella oxytoca]|nr:hypothetical protein [Klebsiella oxytoca]
MEKSTERKSNVIKNAIVAWKEKYNPKDNKGKILMIVGTIFFFICVIRIIALVLSSGADGLPNCNDHKLINEKLPRLVKNRLDKEGYDTLGASIIFSKAEESYYDGKTGVRRCTAVMTIKKGSKIELIDMEYQIAWINKETGEYQYRILD